MTVKRHLNTEFLLALRGKSLFILTLILGTFCQKIKWEAEAFVASPLGRKGPPIFLRARQQAFTQEDCKIQKGICISKLQAATAGGFQIRTSSGDETAIRESSSFMLDSFWMMGMASDTSGAVTIMDSQKDALVSQQALDLQEKYGERLGKRLLDSKLFLARDDEDQSLLGMVGVEVTLLARKTTSGDDDEENVEVKILDAIAAETMLKNAVASLGPKQRRLYKDASLEVLASSVLVPPSVENADYTYIPVCCLSNLAVSPRARRRGVALALCEAVETFAQENHGLNVFLKVEEHNKAARNLYENKLGYHVVSSVSEAKALRLDLSNGGANFVEIEADTLILGKEL